MAAAKAPLKVALFDVAPYVITRPDEAPSGPYVQLAQDLVHQAGLQVSFRIMPFARIAGSLASGEADLTIGFSTEAVDKVAQDLGTVLVVDSLVVTSTKKPARTVAELSNHLIGRARGGCQDLAKLPRQRPELVDVIGFSNGMRMLALGRLDGLRLTREVLDHYARETGIARSELGPEIVLGKRRVDLFARRDLDPKVAEKIRATLSRAGR